MAARTENSRPNEAFRLAPFEPRQAALIASWVSSPQDALWVAPHTPPPITASSVLHWQDQGRSGHVLLDAHGAPVGYGELNVQDASLGHYWLGHILTDPSLRGRGIGRALTRRLLQRGFGLLGARRITLVVFPENAAAIACYRAAGLRDDGWETHDFPPYARRDTLLRMAVNRFL